MSSQHDPLESVTSKQLVINAYHLARDDAPKAQIGKAVSEVKDISYEHARRTVSQIESGDLTPSEIEAALDPTLQELLQPHLAARGLLASQVDEDVDDDTNVERTQSQLSDKSLTDEHETHPASPSTTISSTEHLLPASRLSDDLSVTELQARRTEIQALSEVAERFAEKNPGNESAELAALMGEKTLALLDRLLNETSQ